MSMGSAWPVIGRPGSRENHRSIEDGQHALDAALHFLVPEFQPAAVLFSPAFIQKDQQVQPGVLALNRKCLLKSAWTASFSGRGQSRAAHRQRGEDWGSAPTSWLTFPALRVAGATKGVRQVARGVRAKLRFPGGPRFFRNDVLSLCCSRLSFGHSLRIIRRALRGRRDHLILRERMG